MCLGGGGGCCGVLLGLSLVGWGLVDCGFRCLVFGCVLVFMGFVLFVGLLFVLYTLGFCFGVDVFWVWFAVRLR